MKKLSGRSLEEEAKRHFSPEEVLKIKKLAKYMKKTVGKLPFSLRRTSKGIIVEN